MMLNTLARKFTLAVFISYGSVVWLNYWHQYGYSNSPLLFPPVSSWLRDATIVFLPVSLAVWIGAALSQSIGRHSSDRMSVSTQFMFAALLLSMLSTLGIILVEANRRIISTGLSIQVSFIASNCSRLYPKGNLLLNFIRWLIPDVRALRIHFLAQDGINLLLVNLAITLILILILEGWRGMQLLKRTQPDESLSVAQDHLNSQKS